MKGQLKAIRKYLYSQSFDVQILLKSVEVRCNAGENGVGVLHTVLSNIDWWFQVANAKISASIIVN